MCAQVFVRFLPQDLQITESTRISFISDSSHIVFIRGSFHTILFSDPGIAWSVLFVNVCAHLTGCWLSHLWQCVTSGLEIWTEVSHIHSRTSSMSLSCPLLSLNVALQAYNIISVLREDCQDKSIKLNGANTNTFILILI